MKNYDYQQAFGAYDKTTEAMQKAIDHWLKLYYRADKTKESDPSQRIAYTLVQKLLRTVFSEYSASCDSKFYKGVLDALNSQKQKAMQHALITGTCFIKPCPVAGGFGFSLIPRQNVLVFGRDPEGNVTDMGTVEKSVWGRWYYTLLERRSVNEEGLLTIENRLYRSLNSEHLGAQVALSQHPAYEALPERYTFETSLGGIGMVVMGTPMLNCVDGSADSVSLYAAAAGLIDLIDRNEAQLAGEFERGQSRIIASKDLLDENDRLTQSLFVGLDEDPETVGLHIFAPTLREQSYIARKQEYLRSVESVIGLQRGMLSDVNIQERTATEVSASEGEYNLTVMDFQRMWQKALEETLALCEVLCGIYGISCEKLPPVSIDWGNGVLYDEDKLWGDYKDMVAQGLIAPEVALGWRFGMRADTQQDRDAIRAKYMPH